MRFEVPKFTEVEDKVIGPFTWMQFVFMGGGVGFGVILYFVANFYIFLFFGVPLAILGGLLAFYRPNDRPFIDYLESMLKFFRSNRLYLWKKSNAGVYQGRPDEVREDESLATYVPSGETRNLNSLAKQLELRSIEKPEQ